MSRAAQVTLHVVFSVGGIAGIIQAAEVVEAKCHPLPQLHYPPRSVYFLIHALGLRGFDPPSTRAVVGPPLPTPLEDEELPDAP